MKYLDLNADVAEGFGAYESFEAEGLYDIITSANIACGFHAGDPMIMKRTVNLCLQKKIAIGAHPGYRDLVGFGRRPLQITPEEAVTDVLYQIGALSAFTQVSGAQLQHVKPHGALYNQVMADETMAKALIEATKNYSNKLAWMTLANSPFAKCCQALKIPFVQEVFADRAYDDNGQLVNRKLQGAVIHDSEEALDHVKRMVLYGEVKTLSGKKLAIQADSVCVHGDHPESLKFAEKLRQSLENEGIRFKSFGMAE